ncbi:MAG: type III pantothenate kinase [Candidatus Omnitrophica bacterium]|nr:type III pantothenate kinase [Candidatus Omnitrophota bacterium]
MLLGIDIGNTSISFGVMRKGKVVDNFSILSKQTKTALASSLDKVLSRIHKQYPLITQCLMCSVVPKINSIVIRYVQGIVDINVERIGKDIIVPIANHYHEPSQVGQDRLLVAYAAKCLYGTPTVVIDLGTAITFDVVSKKGTYEGGMIVPGIRLSAESLFKGTALLPQLKEFTKPKHLIGKNTKDSILSGLFNGYSAMCDGLIKQFQEILGPKTKVILTGGYAPLIRKGLPPYCVYDQDLVFRGMSMLVFGMKCFS